VVYNTQNYMVFGLCLSSVILKTRKRKVSETGSVSVRKPSSSECSCLCVAFVKGHVIAFHKFFRFNHVNILMYIVYVSMRFMTHY
jgi:hypothetical protein